MTSDLIPIPDEKNIAVRLLTVQRLLQYRPEYGICKALRMVMDPGQMASASMILLAEIIKHKADGWGYRFGTFDPNAETFDLSVPSEAERFLCALEEGMKSNSADYRPLMVNSCARHVFPEDRDLI